MANEPILVVDDNPSNVKLIKLLLTNAGFEVRTACDSEQALQLLRCFTPRLILMDVQLPGMDGLKLTRQIKGDPVTRNSVIVAVTAYAMRGDEERAKAAGCDGYISKPIDTRSFVKQVRQYLDQGVLPPEDPTPQSCDPAGLLGELRSRFITEGEETSRQFADSDLYDEDMEGMRRLAHHWTGMGGTLGFPEITKRAREMEATLESLPHDWRPLAGQEFASMHELFLRALDKGDELTLSEERNVLTFKQVGLIGFSDTEVRRIRLTFDQVNATAHDLGVVSQERGMDLDSL